MSHTAKKALTILLGQCVPSVKSQASKIRIRRMELDENLLMVRRTFGFLILRSHCFESKFYFCHRFKYFRKDSYVFAHDPNKLCKSGDIVLGKIWSRNIDSLRQDDGLAYKISHSKYYFSERITGKANAPNNPFY